MVALFLKEVTSSVSPVLAQFGVHFSSKKVRRRVLHESLTEPHFLIGKFSLEHLTYENKFTGLITGTMRRGASTSNAMLDCHTIRDLNKIHVWITEID
jgi:hypothetical protein